MKKLLLSILLLTISAKSNATVWYASPTGSGNGTFTNPFNLATALNATSTILPGDVLYLRGGTYKGRFICNLAGNSTSNITITSNIGEWAVLDGNIKPATSPNTNVLYVTGGYVTFSNFEITYSNVTRNKITNAANFVYCGGIEHISGEDCKFINLSIHENPGIAFNSWKETAATLIYGCIVYNNGWIENIAGRTQHGPGFYVQNRSDKIRMFKNNVVFNNFSVGFEVWSAEPTQSTFEYVKNITLEDNTVFNSGSPYLPSSSSFGDNNILAKTADQTGLNTVKNIKILNNVLYHNTNYVYGAGTQYEANSLEVGSDWYQYPSENITITGNFISGRNSGVRLLELGANTVFANNYILGRYVNYRDTNTVTRITQNWSFDNNRYFTDNSNAFRMVNYGGSAVGDKSLSQWQTDNSIDLASTRKTMYVGGLAAADLPPNVLKVTRNEYNRNRFTVALFSPPGNPNVNVDFSKYCYIPPGTSYSITDVESYPSVASMGTLPANSTLSFNLNMTTPAFATPTGTDFTNSAARTPDNFGVFYVDFAPYFYANNTVYSTKIQTDGKIIFGGDFTDINGFSSNRIGRLNANMTFDSTFTVGTGANGSVFATAIQSDGKVIIAGSFATYNGVARKGIARLNANGTLDTTFAVGTGIIDATYAAIKTVAIQSDGKILIAGNFTSYNGTTKINIARLNANGTIDTTFNSSFTASSGNMVNCIAIQSDGKILIGGYFTTYGAASSSKIVRLNSNGTIDTTFTIGTGFDSGATTRLNCLQLQPDGKVLAGGCFSSFNGTSRFHLVRLNSNGNLDTTFIPDPIAILSGDSGVMAISLQTDNKIFIGGGFKMTGTPRARIARLSTTGSLDLTFDPGEGFGPPSGNRSTGSAVNSLSIQTDGKVIAGGRYSTYNNVLVDNLTRLNPLLTGAMGRNSLVQSDNEQDRISEQPVKDPFENVFIYPNPCTDYFTLSASDQNVDFIEVVNSNKEIVKSQKIINSAQKINIETLPEDIYFIKIYSNKNLVKTVKIFKQ